jgi:hypothetical protein
VFWSGQFIVVGFMDFMALKLLSLEREEGLNAAIHSKLVNKRLNAATQLRYTTLLKHEFNLNIY